MCVRTQHAKEVCLVGLRGDPPPGTGGGVASDVIFSMRRGNSQKPTEIYDLVEQLVPNGEGVGPVVRRLWDVWSRARPVRLGVGVGAQAALAQGVGVEGARWLAQRWPGKR